jgi:hypothetical protein
VWEFCTNSQFHFPAYCIQQCHSSARKLLLLCSITQDDDITPIMPHFCSIVDLVCQAKGWLDEETKSIASTPFETDASVWGALLVAC